MNRAPSEVDEAIEANRPIVSNSPTIERERQEREDSSCSSSSSSSEPEEEEPPRKKSKRDAQVTVDLRIDALYEQVSFLTNIIMHQQCASSSNTNVTAKTTDVIEQPEQINDDFLTNPCSITPKSLDLGFCKTDFDEKKVLKPADEQHLNQLIKLQHFNTSTWQHIRYKKALADMLAFPGFCNLKINDEICCLNKGKDFLASTEEIMAAITNALLYQRQLLQSGLQEIVNWSHNNPTELTSNNLFNKISEMFGNSSPSYKLSEQTLQIVCGKRAECIETRRKRLISEISDKSIQAALVNIPPSEEFLFEKTQLMSLVQSLGGPHYWLSPPQTSKNRDQGRSSKDVQKPLAGTWREQIYNIGNNWFSNTVLQETFSNNANKACYESVCNQTVAGHDLNNARPLGSKNTAACYKRNAQFYLQAISAAIGVAKPKSVRSFVSWDSNVVLEWLSANSPKDTLFEISRRTATVLLLASGRRVHDLTLLRISKDNYLDNGQNIYLIPAFSSKTDRHDCRQSAWKLSKHPDKNICPVSLVRCLIEKTKQRRSDIRDLDNLFITISNKVKFASRTVIGNWVRAVLKDSGIDASPGSCRTDDKFLEPIQENVSEELDLKEQITLSMKLIPAFHETDQICEPFTGFSISNWDPETEDSENRVTNWMEENRLNLSQQALAFDMNAEVEPIPQDECQNDLYEEEPLAGMSSEEEADVAVAACVARLAPARLRALPDARPSAPAHARLEYSYCAIVAAWAGPAHWRLKGDRASKMSERSQSTARLTTDGKKPPRTKKQLDFMGAGLAFDAKTNNVPDYEPTQPAKIMISRKTLATGHTWNEANFKTPIDRGLDESHFLKLFLRRNVLMFRERDAPRAPPEPLTVEGNKEYDYNNENDASYCPNHVPDCDDWGNEEATAAGDIHDQVKAAENEELGDMLEPPTKIAKIFIPYAMRAKKVDMKQLKHCTWKMLTEKTPEGEKEDVSETTFFNIYSRLPNKLSTNMRESLSVPLALLSVLHLANEKGLILEKKDDLKDIGIIGLIKN
ncbi:unnamed protein product, partial [Brenthis ino]